MFAVRRTQNRVPKAKNYTAEKAIESTMEMDTGAEKIIQYFTEYDIGFVPEKLDLGEHAAVLEMTREEGLWLPFLTNDLLDQGFDPGKLHDEVGFPCLLIQSKDRWAVIIPESKIIAFSDTPEQAVETVQEAWNTVKSVEEVEHTDQKVTVETMPINEFPVE